MNRKRALIGAVLLLLAGVGALVYWGQQLRRGTELYYSGTIEAVQSNLAFQVGGRVQSVTIDEGQAALLVIGDLTISEAVEKAELHAIKQLRKEVKVQAKEIDKELADLEP